MHWHCWLTGGSRELTQITLTWQYTGATSEDKPVHAHSAGVSFLISLCFQPSLFQSHPCPFSALAALSRNCSSSSNKVYLPERKCQQACNPQTGLTDTAIEQEITFLRACYGPEGSQWPLLWETTISLSTEKTCFLNHGPSDTLPFKISQEERHISLQTRIWVTMTDAASFILPQHKLQIRGFCAKLPTSA